MDIPGVGVGVRAVPVGELFQNGVELWRIYTRQLVKPSFMEKIITGMASVPDDSPTKGQTKFSLTPDEYEALLMHMLDHSVVVRGRMTVLWRFVNLLQTLGNEVDPGLNSQIFQHVAPVLKGESVEVSYSQIVDLFSLVVYSASNQSDLELAALYVGGSSEKGQLSEVASDKISPVRTTLRTRQQGWSREHLDCASNLLRYLIDGVTQQQVRLGDVIRWLLCVAEVAPETTKALLRSLNSRATQEPLPMVEPVQTELRANAKYTTLVNLTTDRLTRAMSRAAELGAQHPMRVADLFCTISGSQHCAVDSAVYTADVCTVLTKSTRNRQSYVEARLNTPSVVSVPIMIDPKFDVRAAMSICVTKLAEHVLNDRYSLNMIKAEPVDNFFSVPAPSVETLPKKRKSPSADLNQMSDDDGVQCTVQSDPVSAENAPSSVNSKSATVVTTASKAKRVRRNTP